MRWERDLRTDSLYIYVCDVPVDHTEEMSDGTIVDVGIGGELVGVEILAVGSGWEITALAERLPLSHFDREALRAITHPPSAAVGSEQHPDASSVGSNAVTVGPQYV
jgi:uncharacterized protein YuzE